ncbi:diguanylate cyclase domain-containing protein [Sporomusa malonica]|uniref:PAS domain S-box-containing protein/diguanylate cyclase (GGDEF) domain-containing protein n=1 Tax=Sporomusa malonica TaxID=112901 RepID=A0A1W1Y936_9FIRM|nr:diguanylate cyclase [Sporomusa malonica]SMC32656.1 PAS domain S-box-containing protein/diguanylate cyclase (GGDEF) domain-containing protein [Sporomusa malonica]
MGLKFTELVDIERLQRLMDTLYKATGIPSGISDLDGGIMTATGWQPICTEFHRVNPQTRQICIESNQQVKEHINDGPFIGYYCKNGMIDYACPIIIEGQHLANLFLGQFFFEPPDDKTFRQQAKKYGFDENAYIKALRQVPILERQTVENILMFFSQLADLLSEAGLRSKENREIANFLQEILNAIPSPVFYKDIKGFYMGCNKAFEEYAGKPREEIIGHTVQTVFPAQTANAYHQMDEELFRHPQTQVYEHFYQDKQGRERAVLFNKAPFQSIGGEVAGLVGVITDITNQKSIEAALTQSEAKYRALFENMMNAFVYFEIVKDDSGNPIEYRFLEVNDAFERHSGIVKTAVIGKTINETVFKADDTGVDWVKLFNDTVRSGKALTFEHELKVLNRWLLVSAYSPLTGFFAMVFSDITQHKKNEEKNQHYAYHDPLTGLPNRRLLEDRLTMAIAQAKRNKEQVAVVFFDLDNFKPVNDTYGHDAGDELLQEIAHRTEACVRQGDTVARIGGDEFVIVLPAIKTKDDVITIATRVLQECRRPIMLRGSTVAVSASIGISFFPQDGTDITELTRKADVAMYTSKQKGRDQICLIDECIRSCS